MKNLLLLPVLAAALSACTMMGGADTGSMSMSSGSMASGSMASGTATGAVSYTLSKQAAATTPNSSNTGQPTAVNLNPMGSIGVTKSATMVMTTASVTGLAPNTYYVAHYHLQGTGGPGAAANSNPCTSNGAAIMASKIVGQTDASGMLKLSGSVNLSDVSAATYFNIHTASDANGTPADAGVACTAVKLQ